MSCLTPLFALTPVAAHWSDRLNHVQQLLKPFAGHWTEWELIPGITGLQLVFAGTIFLATLAVCFVLRRRKSARPPVTDVPVRPSWLRLAAADAIAPARLAVLLIGLHATACVLLFRLPTGADDVLLALGWLRTAGLIGTLFWFIFRAINIVDLELRKWAGRTSRRWDNVLVPVLVRALRLVVPLLGAFLALPSLDLPVSLHDALQSTASLALIGFVGLLLCELITTGERAVIAEYRVDVRDNLATRKIQTQVRILSRILIVLIFTITLACMLTVFTPMRTLGHSILASAGVAGIVLGIAAQRTLGLFLAGIQIAFTQPIRLDDVVIVENEWGRVEEITLTYVVVAIWDMRRMVLPITYFIEKPFQNWTRSSAALLGSIFLYLDYAVPIDALRQEFERVLAASKRWDGRVKALQVTDAKERTVEIRLLASAADSGTSFDLRCEIREKMIDFVRREFPSAFPTVRVQSQADPHPAPAA